ncbi:MAG: helicase-related protein [Acidobacteriota bacterium]|nr:helicase-related protein [Acidobacteriota bacterium]
MTFDVGALVSVRGREWVVQPESEDDLLLLRPLAGDDDQVTGVYLPLEPVAPAAFPPPDPHAQQGNHLSCTLLRDAVRLGFRSGAGPFRALARVAVEPRPYQLAPLLMALRLDPVRLMIADDVGVGKTVEACLIAREMLDRAEIRRLAVLCPPHLAEQWQRALRDQFHIDAELVLAATASRLETDGVSLFERHRFTVVSTDYIKSDRRRQEFLRTCPEMVIVDEAHTCAAATRASQRRHQLLRDLTDPQTEPGRTRHLLLVTATPHSGKHHAFRSLLGLLNRDLDHLPDDISGPHNVKHRDRLARHLIQRRRGDIKAYLDTQTPFPTKERQTDTYNLSPQLKSFMADIRAYCSEQILDGAGDSRRRRIRFWSALSLLQAVSSSPAAAAATLRNRSGVADEENEELIDEVGRRVVLAPGDVRMDGNEHALGGQTEDDDAHKAALAAFAERADSLRGAADSKLKGLVKRIDQLLDDGYQPIVFCRFIPTVDYLVRTMRQKFAGKGIDVDGVTGQLPPAEREYRIEQLGRADKAVLICTDCLSEGINLQQYFNAVVHYDLAWNPTRHEQREGRVDRYGQPSPTVRVLTWYGKHNPVDETVWRVLLTKHNAIQSQLGVQVIPPENISEELMKGIFQQEDAAWQQMALPDILTPDTMSDLAWAGVELEKQSRTKYAQQAILKAVNEELGKELEEVQNSQGDHNTVRGFIDRALPALGASVQSIPSADDARIIDTRGLPKPVIEAAGCEERFRAAFEPGFHRNALVLTRTHALVDNLARYLLEDALDPRGKGPARRCGVVRTAHVAKRTTLLLLRLRFHILTQDRKGVSRPLLAEEIMTAAFSGAPARADWLTPEQTHALFRAKPDGNIPHDLARNHLQKILDQYDSLLPRLQELGRERGKSLLAAHTRVRRAAKTGVKNLDVRTHAPPDALGLYVFLPSGGAP